MDNDRRILVDSATTADLVATLARVDELWKRYEAAGSGPTAPGSPAAGDANLHGSRFVGIHASQAVANALDHLTAWRVMLLAGTIPIQAHVTLLRGALEGAVRCRWLVADDVGSLERVARGYAAKRRDHDERRKFEESPERAPAETPGPRLGKSGAERMLELDAARSTAGVPLVHYADTTQLVKRYRLERWYRLASAAAHGMEWALAAAQREPYEDGPPPGPGIVHGIVSAGDSATLGLTMAAVGATARAIADLERYHAG